LFEIYLIYCPVCLLPLQKKGERKSKKERDDTEEKEKDVEQKDDKETKSSDEKTKEDSTAVTEVCFVLLLATIVLIVSFFAAFVLLE